MREEFLIAHCLDTPTDMDVTVGMIDQWHKGPRDLTDGRVRYMRKNYESRDELPDEYLGGVHIKKLHGRGWDRRGYRWMIKRSGAIWILSPDNRDGFIQPGEVTWGAKGFNRNSVHVALEGGKLKEGQKAPMPFLDLFTGKQYDMFERVCRDFMIEHPEGRIGGHCDIANYKTCPNFDVAEYLDNIGIPSYYIYAA